MGKNTAYAIAITEENINGVIRSEAGLTFDLEYALNWLYENEEGWFLRDEESPLDCQFFQPEVFDELYQFVSADQHSLLRKVIQKR